MRSKYCVLAFFIGCSASSQAGALREPIAPLPPAPAAPAWKVSIGRDLFNDKRLSGDETLSCASCHDLSAGGADNRERALGAGGRTGSLNTLTVLNAALNPMLFWDGRALSLEEQMDGPITSPLEMNSNWPQIIERLSRDRELRRAFERGYSDGLTKENVQDALATFEQSLIVSDNCFDAFLRGRAELPREVERGYRHFKSYGCTACHQGVNVGGNLFAYVGTMEPYQESGMGSSSAERIRVPSLRMAGMTPPYFHDGSVPTLDRAIELMGRHQFGVEIPPEERREIANFLHSLGTPCGASR